MVINFICKTECTTGTYTAMYHAVNFAFHHMCIYVYLYKYKNITTTEVQIYIRGISLVRTSPNSSNKKKTTTTNWIARTAANEIHAACSTNFEKQTSSF